MRKLHIMSELPASGKSTFCDEHGRDDIVIHRDIVRQHLRELLGSEEYFPCSPEAEYKFYMEYIRTAAEASDKDIWIDQTTLSNGAAKKLLSALDYICDLDKFDIIFEIIRTPVHVCLNRNMKRTGFARVPEDTIKSMAKGFNISLTGLLDIFPDNNKFHIGVRYIDWEEEDEHE